MEAENNESLVVTVEETRKLLGLSRGLVYQAISTGEIPSIRIGRRILIPRAALKRLLDGNNCDKKINYFEYCVYVAIEVYEDKNSLAGGSRYELIVFSRVRDTVC